jgi:F-type H+-transporting ATPase subunit delta
MKAGRASIRYAKALLEFAIESQKEKAVVEEMQNILSVVESSPELDDALNSPVLPSSQKRRIIDGIFPKASKIVQ